MLLNIYDDYLNNKRRDIQESESLNPKQKLPPRPVWLPRKLKKLKGSDVHECLGKDSAFGIAIDLELLIMLVDIVPGFSQPAGQRVVVDKGS